jgi:hypothetical protein
MPLSVYLDFGGDDWPLGVVTVAAPGTPVNIMRNVDPNNNWAGATVSSPASPVAEYAARCHRIWFQGYHAGANNNGLVQNTGQVYVVRAPGPGNNNTYFPGGPGNRSDSGAVVAVVPPGGNFMLPAMEQDGKVISPYRYTLDADTAGEGALVTLINCGR